ncbi:MAG: SDR family NAD(P)-dependent oxidoreductase [Acidobacteriota bacterium]
MTVLILGCGFTGERVARRFLARGARVIATTRDPARLILAGAEIVRLEDVSARIDPGSLVLHSIPPEGLRDLDFLGTAPARLVYLSTTGVYGAAAEVDAATPVDWSSERAKPRLQAERAAAAGPWSTLILRPAAIYGPGRGVHESVRRGTYPPGENFISRIHVDDLAAHAEAGLLSDLTGAYPVADEEPCTSREIAEFCSQLLNVPLPTGPVAAPRIFGDRKVDGSAIRALLGVTLRYASYRTGIPTAIEAATVS